MSRIAKNLIVSLCALTGTTEQAARRFGVGYFLPELTVDRFANMGGIDKRLFAIQLQECRSFDDEAWADYWRRFAVEHLDTAAPALERLGGPAPGELLAPADDGLIARLGAVLAPAVDVFAERAPETVGQLVTSFIADNPDHVDAAIAIDELVKAMTYLFVASWPGWTPSRLQAYAQSQCLFEALIRALAPAMGIDVEVVTLHVEGEAIKGYAAFPAGSEPTAAVLITNGLEGASQEVAIPILKYRHNGMAVVTMEMPGTYAYRKPLSPESENLYAAMLDHIAAHPRVDADRIGMVGVSFGAHWSARMAARDKRIKAVVCNGGLYHRSFTPASTFGKPAIILETLRNTTGATSLIDLGRRLHALSLKARYPDITVPLLVINGDTDTLVSTRDSVDLADAVPNGELILYPNDDHCAMGHYSEWLATSVDWLQKHLD
ncbi:alpha/beta hydrolase [Mycolicibacterium sp. lyk4-40-TYG-92]|uniref:alpha/beta hydrolase family protein n=1 Tax=Mycolicibacterium sp. lyk4-40-TYG-92 TaxID=3040295 RepID=UPI00254FF7C5|nr:alpha/beta hydrolase [Mycolicibacterium sp. lyk4-40-TYG-92]